MLFLNFELGVRVHKKRKEIERKSSTGVIIKLGPPLPMFLDNTGIRTAP